MNVSWTETTIIDQTKMTKQCIILDGKFPSFHPSLFARSPKVSLTFIPQIGIGKRQIVSERRVLLPVLLEKIVKGKKVFANNNYIQKLRQYQL